MQQEDIKVLVVGMPSLPMNRALLPDSFWQEFRGQLLATTKAHGAEWLDLTDSTAFEKSDFLDTVHLNASGGEKLFALMAANIHDRDSLASSLRIVANRGIALKGIPH